MGGQHAAKDCRLELNQSHKGLKASVHRTHALPTELQYLLCLQWCVIQNTCLSMSRFHKDLGFIMFDAMALVSMSGKEE